MSPYHRYALLELSHAQDRVLWSYAAEIESDPKAVLTVEDLCLTDFSRRSVALLNTLLAEPRRRAPHPSLRPPSPEAMQRFHDELDQRKREADQAKQEADEAERHRVAGMRQATPRRSSSDEEPPTHPPCEAPLPPITDRANAPRRFPGTAR